MTDIKKLTKEQKIELLEALKEKRRREKLKKPMYTPNSGQLLVHQSKAADRFITSGNGSGKTTMAVQEVMWRVNGYNPILKEYTPVPARVIVVVDLPAKITDLWVPSLQNWFTIEESWLKKHGKPFINEIAFPNGSSIKFMTHDQPELAVESIELDMAVYDEPPKRRLFVGLKRGSRIKGRKSRHLLIGTPIAASWLRSMIYEPWMKGELTDTECFRYGTEVNRANLAEGYIENFSKILTEKERKVRLEGEFYDMDGLALAHLFKKATHVVSRPQLENKFSRPIDPVVVAIDPHPSKSHTCVMLGVSKHGQLYYIKEMAEKLVARDFAKKLKQWYQGYRVVDIVVDSLGSAEMTGGEGFRSFIEILNEEGVRCRATTFEDKSDEDFIERIRDVLKIPEVPDNFGLYIPKLLIVEGNPGIVKDIENASWLKHKDIDENKPKIDIRQLDYLACLKYALAANPHYNKGREKVHKPQKNLYGFGKPKTLAFKYRRK